MAQENGLTFYDCCLECLRSKDLVKEFNRLKGLHLLEARKPFEIAIDQACGYNPNDIAMPEFIKFCYYYVWTPMVMQEEKANTKT